MTSLYHYDCDVLAINESRVLEGDWEWKNNVATYFVQHATVQMIRNLFLNMKGKLEAEFYWEYMGYKFTKNWLDAIDERWLVPEEYAGNFLEEMEGKKCLIIPKRLIEALVQGFHSKVNVIGVVNDEGEVFKEPDERQAKYIGEALKFLKDAGFEVMHKIIITDFKNNVVLGRARKDTIELSSKLFDMGKKMIVAVILEEESHLNTGYSDKTREMQDFLFMRLVSLMEEKIGVVL